jgi:hypothetical protein
MLERYRIAEGDRVHLVETEDGILITPFDPAFAEAMALYEEGAKQYRNAMRELAKCRSRGGSALPCYAQFIRARSRNTVARWA